MVKKKTEIEAPANAALQASITPVGIEFGMNKLRLGENYCRIYGIFMLPTEVEYGWLSKLTNIPGTIVTINYEPRNNAEAINDLSRKIRMFRGQAASTKDPKERMRCEKAALSQETALQRMDSGNESMGVAAQYFNVLSWCWEQITRDRKERIMLIADECWTMIDPRCPQSLEFLKNAEKRARKYEGSIVVGTQSTNDFLDPEVKFYGQSVLDLPTYKLLFSMDGQSLKEAAELFDLNDSQTELISSGQRGMALMKVGRQAAKVRFVLSDERLEMFGRGGGR